jgi:transposase
MKLKKKKIKIKFKSSLICKNKIVNSKYFIPKLTNENYSNLITNTFFDIKKYTFNIQHNNLFNSNIKNTNDDYIKNEVLIPQWFYKKDNSLLRARQYELITTKYQKGIILKWIEMSRIIYNITVYYFRKHKLISFMKVRKIIKNSLSNQIKRLLKLYNTPEHIIDNSINDVIKAYTSILANKKAGNITKFLVRYKKHTKDNQTIVIEKEDFSKNKNGFYVKYLSENKKFIEFKTKPEINLTKSTILHNVRLTYMKLKDKFILHIPTEVTKESNITNNKCFIDPGNKTFLTIYNPKGECYKLYNRDENKRLFKLIDKRYILKKILEEKYNKNNIKRNPILINKFNKCYKQISYKIKNLIKELHNKSADFLCKNFDKILLGKLSTKGVTSKNNNMSSKEKRYTYTLSHDKFRTVLQNKIEKYNCKELKIVDESYTTRTCGLCGVINNTVGNNRLFNCKYCITEIDRDLNSARLIGIKNE